MLRLLTLLCLIAAPLAAADKATADKAIRDVMAQQQTDWNAGKIPEFMAGYLNSPDLRFGLRRQHYQRLD